MPVKKFGFLLRPIFAIFCRKFIRLFKNRSRRARVDQNDIKFVFCMKNCFFRFIIPKRYNGSSIMKIKMLRIESPKERILHGNMLLSCDQLLDHCIWELNNDKINKTTSASNSTFTAEKQRSKVRTKQKRNQENRSDSDDVDYQTDDFDADVEQSQSTPAQISSLLKDGGREIGHIKK